MKRVLVAEQAPFLLRMLRRALSRAGYRVQTVSDGATAWRLLQEQPPDALVTAVTLPGCSGIELASRLGEDPSLRHLPTIVMSGRADPAIGKKLASMESVVLLGKPISMRLLLSALQELFADDSTVATCVGADLLP